MPDSNLYRTTIWTSARGNGPAMSNSKVAKLINQPEQLIKVACALRVKYRRSEKVRLQPFQVGFHPRNRGGAELSGIRCLDLTKLLVKQGYDDEEADCGGVVVESGPVSMVMDHNVAACAGDPRLMSTVDGQILMYGSLAHSHLNQVLKNIRGGMLIALEERMDLQHLIVDGRISLALLAQHDATFARFVRDGLLMDVLSADLDVEEPEGAEIISAACNVKNSASLIPHEMEGIVLTSTYCSKSSDVAGAVAYDTLRDKLAQSMPHIANDPDFICIFKFVIEVGAGGSNHINFLNQFVGRFVDPKKRHLRLASFSVVSELPATAVHLKIALLICAYTREPTHMYCDGPSRPLWKKITAKHWELLEHAQQLLFFFSEKKQHVLAKLDTYRLVKFKGLLYKDVADCFTNASEKKGKEHMKMLLKEVAFNNRVKFCRLCPEDECKDMPAGFLPEHTPYYANRGPCMCPTTTVTASGVCATCGNCGHGDGPSSSSGSPAVVAKKTTLEAVVNAFDKDGKIISLQQEVVPKKEGTIDWTRWGNDVEVAKRAGVIALRAVAYSVCAQMWQQQNQPIGQAPTAKEKHIQIVKPVKEGGNGKCGKFTVQAVEDIEEGNLLLVPYIAAVEKLCYSKSIHPDAIVVMVQEQAVEVDHTVNVEGEGITDAKGKKVKSLKHTERIKNAQVTYSVSPDCSLRSDAEVKEKGGKDIVSRCPFWACKRSSKETEWNCDLFYVQSNSVVIHKWQGLKIKQHMRPDSCATNVDVPVLVNTRKIPKGTEVVLKCDPPAPPKKQDANKNKRTWETDAKRMQPPKAPVKKAKV